MTTQPPPIDLGPKLDWVRWDRIGAATWREGDTFPMALPYDDRTSRPQSTRTSSGMYVPRANARSTYAGVRFHAHFKIAAAFAQHAMGRLTRFTSYARSDEPLDHDVYAILPPLVLFGRMENAHTRSAHGDRLYILPGARPLLFVGDLWHMKVIPIARKNLAPAGEVALDAFFELGRADQRFVHDCCYHGGNGSCGAPAELVCRNKSEPFPEYVCGAHKCSRCTPIVR